ncbi:phenylacetate-CoA oxygenase subunit PaaC [Sphingomonas naphthae]|uniref:Phenylacetate-CoA oxygenase subunit PaaC n=1 Tax=Sphingomonas naphthae TaxID=1813468 RepID=A0ABY7THU3_9SPHN|nr:1,2-phenylacetyl-CoA epoxidase subunit PaaC [Sphingomonas naphthae]WCT72458.1 phenylacetate-CoA oxygenase subunit PaaC [Sphingomonas naphthae]
MADALAAARFAQSLRLGDDALILGQRLGEWAGHAPTLEVDLALTNIGLDLIGQAQHFLGYAGELEGKGQDADGLAFRRDVYDFRNCLLVEQPNGDFARTIARQYLFSAWQLPLMQGLAASADRRIADVAEKAVKEIAYHVRFSGEWIVRLGDGTAESKRRMEAALAWCWRFVDELFESDPAEAMLVEAGEAVDRAALRPAWDAAVDAVLAEAGLARPTIGRGVTGGRAGRHSEHLGHILSEMQFLPRAYPDAVW